MFKKPEKFNIKVNSKNSEYWANIILQELKNN